MTTHSQPIAASQTQRISSSLAAPAIAIIPPPGTLVPSGFVFVETIYEPDVNVTEEEVAKLSDNDLLTGLKKQRKRTQAAMDAFIVFYDEVVARYSEVQPRTDKGQFQRCDKPTLSEAFAAIGLRYETERKRRQRYLSAINVRIAAPRPPQLCAGDPIQTRDTGTKGEVGKVHETAPKADVIFEGAQYAVTVPTSSLKKIPARKINYGDVFIDVVSGAQYRYVNDGKLSRTQTPDYLQRKQQRELARIEASQKRERAKAEEKERQNEVRKAEAERREAARSEKAKATKEAALEKKAAAKAARAKKLAVKAGAKSAALKAVETKSVLVARIGNTREFGVFAADCAVHDKTNAITRGTREYCEGERGRINSGVATDAGSHHSGDDANA